MELWTHTVINTPHIFAMTVIVLFNTSTFLKYNGTLNQQRTTHMYIMHFEC